MRTALAALVLAALPVQALACACCSDAGQRYRGTGPLDAHDRGVLDAVDLSGTAVLYTTPCGYECIRGVADPEDRYRASLHRADGIWHFDLTAAEPGAGGRLSFALPDRIETLTVDPTPDEDRHTPVLYKEWRLSGPLHAAGIFAPAMAAGTPQATLVLHGQGNSCTSEADFTNWTLDVSGPSAKFRLFGKLVPQ